MKRCGTRARISLSLKLPGLRLVGVDDEVVRVRVLVGLRDEAPLAAGREERAATAAQLRREQLVDHGARLERARLRERLVAADRLYSASFVRSRSSASAITILTRSLIARAAATIAGTSSGCTLQAVVPVDRDDRPPAAAAEALDRPQRRLPSSVVSPASAAELVLEGLEHGLRAVERARDVRADLDHVLADRLEVELVVERRDCVAVGRRQLERVGDLAERIGREPAVLLLCEAERRQHGRGRAIRVELAYGLDVVVQTHVPDVPLWVRCAVRAVRVTGRPRPSPCRASRRSRSCRRSARRSCTSRSPASATNDGARNLTRHGFGPPSETT